MNQTYQAVNTSIQPRRVGPKVAGALGLCLGLAFSQSAFAQNSYGRKGDISIGAERLFGFYSDHVSEERAAPLNDLSTTGTQIGLFYHSPLSAFAVPRLTFDYFLTDHLSLGTALGYYQNDPDTVALDEQNGFILAPRVGYAFMFTDRFGVHPHGGFTYVRQATHYKNDDDSNQTQLAISLDGTFIFLPAPNVGFTGALILDLGLTGSTEDVTGAEFDRHEQLVGVAFGMFAHF